MLAVISHYSASMPDIHAIIRDPPTDPIGASP
jgi:hypothetical protein